MMRSRTILLFAVAMSIASSAAAQVEPPKTILDVSEPPNPGEAVFAASSAITSALDLAPAGTRPLSEGLSGAEELPATDETGAMPSIEELAGLGDPEAVAAVEDAAAEIEEPPAPIEVRELPWSTADFDATLALLRNVRQSVGESLAGVEQIGERLRNPSRAGMLDLRPYVDHDGWPEVVQLLYDDHCKEAKQKAEALVGEPTDATEPALVYFWARIQMCAGEEAEGRETLKRLARSEGPVAVLAARRLGNDVVVVEGEEETGMYLSQRLRRVKRRAANDLDGALSDLDELYGEMTRRWDRFKVRQARAQILEGARKYDDAAEVYLDLYRTTRGWKINDAVEDHIEELEQKAGKKYLTYGERIDRMRHLIKRGRYSDARRVSVENARIRGVSGGEMQGWKYYRLALQAEREKDREEAVKLFEKADRLVKDSEVRPRLYFGWARALRRLDRDPEAIALYERLVKEFPTSHLCDDATYEAGRLLQFASEHERAVAKFVTVTEEYPHSEFVPDALWRRAFSAYLQKKWDDAVAPLERLRAEFAEERDRSELSLGLKATYWLAMTALRAGEDGRAEELFQETIERGPLTWYGRLAVARMEQRGWVPKMRLPTSRMTQDELRNLASLRVPAKPRLAVAGEFVRLGLWKDALSEMRDQVSIHPVPDGAHRLLASIYLANGRPNWAHWIMKKHISETGPTWATLRDWGTAFPLDYMELSHEYGTKHEVSPFLVQAIIRQESGFRPGVKSWAGAVGLMQLMPGTGRMVARRFIDPPQRIRVSDLKKPEKNVELGSMYIRLHTAQTHDNVPLALAAYNAGTGPLLSWIERYGDRELDAFVESITYQEARGYVRKVFTSYVTYSALYGGELPEVEFEVPKKLRKFGDIPNSDTVDPSKPVSLLR